MPEVKVIGRSVQNTLTVCHVEQAPKLGVGDYVEIYFGRREGCCFWIKDLRYNAVAKTYEYLDGGWCADWYVERALVLLKQAERPDRRQLLVTPRENLRKFYEDAVKNLLTTYAKLSASRRLVSFERGLRELESAYWREVPEQRPSAMARVFWSPDCRSVTVYPYGMTGITMRLPRG